MGSVYGLFQLNTVTFDISKSLAPDVLNTGLINALRYGLLANVRAPLLEHAVPPQKKKVYLILISSTFFLWL